MKHLKQKLIAATTMMLLCAIMLSSVSYAWFTLSTNPEITNMDATIAANQNLEIALDNGYANEGAVDSASVYTGTVQGSKTGDPYTWGNLVDLGVAFGTTGLNPVMQPVKYTNTTGTVKFEVPTYGVDGRVSALAELKADVFDDVASKNATGGVKGYSVTQDAAPYYAFSVDFWVRSNVAGNLDILTAAGTDRAEDADDTNNTVNNTAGAGSYIEVVGYGSMTQEQKTAVAAYFAKMKIVFVVAGENTDKVATLGTIDTNGKITVTCDNITGLVRNTAEKVSMYVYLDGETITNKDAILADIADVNFNIQFDNDGISGSEAATGNDAATPAA